MRFHLLILTGFVLLLLPASSAGAAADIRELVEQMQRQQLRAQQDVMLVRPTPLERDAITKLIEQNPRPKTLNDADIKWLKYLLDKAVWLGAERRILYQLWEEVTGKPLGGQDGSAPKPSEGAQ